MASQAYYDWLNAGKPYTLARPCRDLQAVLRTAGYTVYDYPDERHQLADKPEDHTPFSATGWPIASKRWIGHALDIMPRAGLMPLPALARRIIAARDARIPGTEWIKYLNWTDEQGRCWHERWSADGSRTTTPSTDKGHIHISARSDMDTSDVVSAAGWNPLEDDMTPDEHAHLIALAYRMLSALMLDPALAANEAIAVKGRITSVPLIDLLKRVDERLAALESRPSVVAVPVDQAALDLAVGKALSDMAALAAVAKAVADELHKRTES